jgi:hypothetical protein
VSPAVNGFENNVFPFLLFSALVSAFDLSILLVKLAFGHARSAPLFSVFPTGTVHSPSPFCFAPFTGCALLLLCFYFVFLGFRQCSPAASLSLPGAILPHRLTLFALGAGAAGTGGRWASVETGTHPGAMTRQA